MIVWVDSYIVKDAPNITSDDHILSGHSSASFKDDRHCDTQHLQGWSHQHLTYSRMITVNTRHPSRMITSTPDIFKDDHVNTRHLSKWSRQHLEHLQGWSGSQHPTSFKDDQPWRCLSHLQGFSHISRMIIVQRPTIFKHDHVKCLSHLQGWSHRLLIAHVTSHFQGYMSSSHVSQVSLLHLQGQYLQGWSHHIFKDASHVSQSFTSSRLRSLTMHWVTQHLQGCLSGLTCQSLTSSRPVSSRMARMPLVSHSLSPSRMHPTSSRMPLRSHRSVS